ncbi:hypothetical protein [uncultured Microbacterium sp.]|uniref:hypothetical protein n=1 Tax=uncultured Microbacterium sp. TaxID=191216 RepID=UPI0025EC6A6B|nr:hypothetical protein [uncultured Microbacterium sp.]
MTDAPDPGFPDLTPPGFSRSVDHGRVQSLHYPDGTIRVRHECHRPRDGRTLIHAPTLTIPGHVVVSTDPVTITPSFLCSDCGMHGFLTDGVWRDC